MFISIIYYYFYVIISDRFFSYFVKHFDFESKAHSLSQLKRILMISSTMKLRLFIYILTGSAIAFNILANTNLQFGVPAVVQAQTVVALSTSEVGKIARQITVQLERENDLGTGVIIKKEGSTYTVLTAAHVVAKSAKQEIIAPDGKRYALSEIKPFTNNIDLAIVKFTSNQNYSTAKIGNSDASVIGKATYIYGFPKGTLTTQSKRVENFTIGIVNANGSQPNEQGYTLAYSNETLPGMSGSPILNDKGELIGIHGKGENAQQVSNINSEIAILKTSRNFGIPINTFVQLATTVGVNLGISAPKIVATAPKADDFFIQGENKYNKGDYQGAIAAYTEAIRLNPKYGDAYNNRGLAHAKLGNHNKAIEDYNQALRINPNNFSVYANRGTARLKLGDSRRAVEDIQEALSLRPGEKQVAIEDYNQALRLNPNLANVYVARGLTYYELRRKRDAIADLEKAANLYRKQGNTKLYQATLDLIRQIQQ